jgi:hypothetical protein
LSTLNNKSPVTLLRAVRDVSGEATASFGVGGCAGGDVQQQQPVARAVSFVDGQGGSATLSEAGAAEVDPSAEIGDIDRRLNQLQEFLRQAKQGSTAS